MATKVIIKERKEIVEQETVTTYLCDICGNEVSHEKIVYVSSYDVENCHRGSLDLCQRCNKLHSREEDAAIDRIRKELGLPDDIREQISASCSIIQTKDESKPNDGG